MTEKGPNGIDTSCLLGIQEEMVKFGTAREFKLKGNPFSYMTSAEQAIEAKKLAAQLLYKLHNFGCKLLVSSDLAMTNDLTTWIFHREQTVAAQFNFACIGVSSSDSLQLINFSSGMNEMLKGIVERNWPQEIQKTKLIGDTLEIKLRGNPWRQFTGGASENIQSRTLIKALINELDMKQWILYGSSNLRATADTLFFKYDPAVAADGSRIAGFVLSLNKNDRLRCVDAPKDATNCVKKMIVQSWVRGVQEEKQNYNAYEFKLKGTPWWADGKMAVDSRLLICKIFEGLWSIGWRPQIAIGLSRNTDDKSIVTFQRTTPMSVPIFCLSLIWTDKIRVINAPSDVINAIVAEVRRLWLFGISSEGVYGASFEMKLSQNPWTYGMTGHDGAHGRVLLLYLLKLLASMGWFLIISADVSAKWVHQENCPDYPIDVHSWWFMKASAPSQGFAPAPPPFEATQFGMQGQGFSAFRTAPPSYAEVNKM